MADEISIIAQLSINKPPFTFTGGGRTKLISQSGTGNQGSTQTIGTTTEAIALTDIDDLGYIYVENIDATNFVMIGLVTPVSASNAFAHLLPGEFCLVPTRQETIYAIADTSACNCVVAAAER